MGQFSFAFPCEHLLAWLGLGLGKLESFSFLHIVFKGRSPLCDVTFLQCTGVSRKQYIPMHWCCLVTDLEMQSRKPRDMVLYYKNDFPITCQTGWAGRNCEACDRNFGPVGQCNQCLRGFAGEKCNECVTNFGPPGNCNRCVLGWTGDNCDVCEFGFSTESNCTECIQNGHWTGTYSPARAPFIAYLTFEGPACTSLVPGV